METKLLYALFDRKYNEDVKPFIEDNFPRSRFSEPIYHILDGFQLRRFRAAFPVIFAEEYKVPKERVLPIAAASELAFTIALIHDDIIDMDQNRGEIPAAHAKYGTEICIASSDFAYAHIARILGSLTQQRIPSRILKKIFGSFIDAHERLYRSFMAEKLEANKFDLPQKTILETYKDKTIQGTNSLFCASLVCTNDEGIAGLIRNYSYDLAIAGQIKNDVYDATSYLRNRGYSDLKNGYITYVIRKLLDAVLESERENLVRMIRDKEDDGVIAALKSKGIIQLCLADCDHCVESAISRVRGIFSYGLEDILLAWAEGNRVFSRQI